jgi:hypothetical protein
MPQSDSKATEPASPATLADEQIVTERKLPRRSFFIAAGALVACGNNSGQGRSDPHQNRADPQAARRPDPDQKKSAADPQKP